MKLGTALVCAALGCAVVVLAVNSTPARAAEAAPARYHCPMHPEYVLDHMGDCPACGMKLVPVKAAAAPAPVAAALTVRGDQQRILGIAVTAARRSSASRALRAPGRVAPDETRLWKLNAGIGGSFRDVPAVTTGSRVRKDQYLGSFFAPESVMAVQLFILNSQGFDRAAAQAAVGEALRGERDDGVGDGKTPNSLTKVNLRQRLMQFQNMGISPRQMEEIALTHQVPATIAVYAPADGFVLARGAFEGLKFDRGFEFYKIADLRKVWVLADVFQQDAGHVHAGMRAEVTVPGGRVRLPATVVEVLPQFDAATRTLKVKLSLDNPGFVLRPDMFVDVSMQVELPPAVVVPADAVVDSGLVQRVFVQDAAGAFAPRAVETGWRAGDEVEVVKGLSAGELVVTAGTFFLDSETRMKAPPVSGAAAPGSTSVPSGSRPRGGAGEVREEAVRLGDAR